MQTNDYSHSQSYCSPLVCSYVFSNGPVISESAELNAVNTVAFITGSANTRDIQLNYTANATAYHVTLRTYLDSTIL